MRTALGFLSTTAPADYGNRLSRLRWQRALPAIRTVSLEASEPALEAFSRADAWFVVKEASALPLWSEVAPPLRPGWVLVAAGPPASASPVHTLRELETAPWRFADGRPMEPTSAPALAFRAADFPPEPGETVAVFLDRLLGGSNVPRTGDPGFSAVRFDDPSERERPELERLIPAGALRLLDVGCGSGGASEAAMARRPNLTAVGIERDPAAARRARGRLDRVLEGDAVKALEILAAEGERFDAFLFADVLEHLEDPIRALSIARTLAASGATLVASVPNAGHLSLVRDLILGRFDPLPAGLADAGHLRWLTRASLSDMLEHAGWRVSSTEASPGAAAPGGDEFLSWALRSQEIKPENLRAYQWIAMAVAE